MKARAYKSRRKAAAKGNTPFFKSSTEGFFGKTYQSAIAGNMHAGGARLHTDAHAAFMAENINAKAFTVGQDIFFNKNEYQPQSAEGKKLIAHEVAHATQHSQQPGIMRKEKDDKENDKRSYRAHYQFWTDLNKNFPDAGRKLAGSGYDKKLDWLKADFTEGEVKEKKGSVHHSAPTMIIGKSYVDEPDEKKRISYIPGQMSLIDDWRFKNYRIDDADLDAVKSKLGAMSFKDMKDYEQKLVARSMITKRIVAETVAYMSEQRFDKYWVDDSDAGNQTILKKLATLSIPQLQRWKTELASFGKANKRPVDNMISVVDAQIAVAVGKTISTPITPDGNLVLDALNQPEKVTYSVSNATIEILPDTTGNIQSPGQTELKPNFDTSTRYEYDTSTDIITRFYRKTASGKVTVTMPDHIVMTILTTYQPGVNKLDPSAYGRGTTDKDKEDKNTSLQFHEGSHGTDYLVGAKALSYPASLQPGVITRSEYAAFIAAIAQISADSETTTDEVGYTKTQHDIDEAAKKKKK